MDSITTAAVTIASIADIILKVEISTKGKGKKDKRRILRYKRCKSINV